MKCPPGLPIPEEDWQQTPLSVQAVVIALWHENHLLKQQVGVLQKQVANLQAEVTKLCERVNRNSKNSSKPPSSHPPYQRKYPKQAPSGQKKGGQKGHPGKGRKLKGPEQVNRIVVSKPLTAPVDGDFAWINQGGATVSTTNGGITLTAPASGGMSMRIRKKAAPATPYTVTAMILPTIYLHADYSFFGIGFRQPSDGKLAYFRCGSQSAEFKMSSVKANSVTSDLATYADIFINNFPPRFLRITDNGTNRISSYSENGINFITFPSVSRTDHITADEIFFFADARNASYPVYATLLSWKEE